MFEKATRTKLRFHTARGDLAVEDLWDLPLTSSTDRPNLDAIAVGLHHALGTSNLSFVKTPAQADDTNQLRFNIVKHVIDTRLAENAARDAAASNAEKKQGLLALIAKKESEALEGHSLEDLRKLVADLS